MAKFVVRYTETAVYEITVEADTADEALVAYFEGGGEGATFVCVEERSTDSVTEVSA